MQYAILVYETDSDFAARADAHRNEADWADRRLAAVLMADVVGYSRLMNGDEIGTVAALKALRADVLQPMVVDHGGVVVDMAGDSLLAQFPSVRAAVACAVAIQERLRAQAAGSPGGPLALRIGITIGDLIVDGTAVYGDGVNAAARLQALAPPGGILVSAVVRDLLDDKAPYRLTDAGRHPVKNMGRPLHAYRVHLSSDAAPGRGRPGKARAIAIALLTALGAAAWSSAHWITPGGSPPAVQWVATTR